MRTFSERLLGNYTPEPNTGCWLWDGYVRADGYGVMATGNSRSRNPPKRAHRLMYEMLVGPIPDGLHLDHLCRVRCCVNPAHLEPVTHRTNVLRGVSPMADQARRMACPLGHPYDEGNTYRPPNGSRQCRTCNRERNRRAERRRTLAAQALRKQRNSNE